MYHLDGEKKFVTFTRKTAQYVKIYNSPPVKVLNKSLHSQSPQLVRWLNFSFIDFCWRTVQLFFQIDKKHRKHSSLFLAHLSRRLTRWTYRMGLEPAFVRPSVCASVRPHFQTWISPRPAGRLQSNFIWSIIGVGERLHFVLVQIRSELWFPWQRTAPIGL